MIIINKTHLSILTKSCSTFFEEIHGSEYNKLDYLNTDGRKNISP